MIQSSFNRVGAAILGFVFVTVIAFSWLVFPYFVNGDKVLFETGQQVQVERMGDFRTLNQMLTRYIYFPGGIEVTALYASDEYFQFADREGSVADYRPDKYNVFFISEDVHTGWLPQGLSKAELIVGDETINAVSAEGPDLVEHHRTTILQFPKFNDAGRPYIDDSTDELRLRLTHTWDRDRVENDEYVPVPSEYVWELPLNIPDELLSRDTFTNIIETSRIGLMVIVPNRREVVRVSGVRRDRRLGYIALRCRRPGTTARVGMAQTHGSPQPGHRRGQDKSE